MADFSELLKRQFEEGAAKDQPVIDNTQVTGPVVTQPAPQEKPSGFEKWNPTLEWERQEKSKDTFTHKLAEKQQEEYNKYQDLASSAQDHVRNLDLMKEILKDDNFYSGTGDQKVLDMKKVLVALGKDPNDKAAPNEIFKKLMAGGVLEGLGQFRGLGQIRVAEIEQLQKSLADSNMTKPAIEAVLNLNQKAHERYIQIGDLATKYAMEHGNRLDLGWDKHLRDWKKNNPFMTSDQIKNWKSEFAGIKKEVAAEKPGLNDYEYANGKWVKKQ